MPEQEFVVTKDTVLRKVSDVKWRDEDFGLLLCNHRGQYLMFNQMGKLVWEMVDGSRKVVDMIQAVQEKYAGAAPELIEKDVLTFARSIITNHLAEAG